MILVCARTLRSLSLRFKDLELERGFVSWYKFHQLLHVDGYALLCDLVLDLIFLARYGFNTAVATCTVSSVLSLALWKRHKDLYIRRRAFIVAVQHLAVAYAVQSAISSLASPPYSTVQFLRNLLGTSGGISLLIMSVQFRDLFYISPLKHVVSTWVVSFGARNVCADGILMSLDGRQYLISMASFLDRHTTQVIRLPLQWTEGKASLSDFICLPVIYLIQIIMGVYVTSTVVASLELYARVTYLRELVKVIPPSGDGSGQHGSQGGVSPETLRRLGVDIREDLADADSGTLWVQFARRVALLVGSLVSLTWTLLYIWQNVRGQV